MSLTCGARDLVGILVELPPGMELGHDHLGGRDPLLGMDVGGDAATVVDDGAGAVGVEHHGDQIGMAGERLVDGVVDHLVDHVMQAGAVVGVADIHARPLAHGIEALQDLDRFGAVTGRLGGEFFWKCFGHTGLANRNGRMTYKD